MFKDNNRLDIDSPINHNNHIHGSRIPVNSYQYIRAKISTGNFFHTILYTNSYYSIHIHQVHHIIPLVQQMCLIHSKHSCQNPQANRHNTPYQQHFHENYRQILERQPSSLSVVLCTILIYRCVSCIICLY
jgi:hypothetical protein